MKREIKFKAKYIDEDRWMEGDLVHHGDRTYIYDAFVDEGKVEVDEIEVDPNTVCQFTGFTDNKGQDIYENDILEHIKYPNIKLCIKWFENRYAFQKISGEVETYNLATSGFLENYIVVGSMFDKEYKKFLQEPKDYSLHKPSDPSTKMTLAEFIEDCKDGYLIDDDGIGYYGTDTAESNLEISPSDVTEREYRTDFTHVYWYNK